MANQFINIDLKLFFKEALKRKIIKKQYYKKNTISQIKILNEIDQVHQTDSKRIKSRKLPRKNKRGDGF